MKNKEPIDLSGSECYDTVFETPQWVTRWGFFSLMLFFILIFFLMYFIRYPDVITSEIGISVENRTIIGRFTILKTTYPDLKKSQISFLKIRNPFDGKELKLKGIISKISEIPNQNTYMVELIINFDHQSTFYQYLESKKRIHEKIEIFFEDKNVLARIINKLNL